MTEENLIPEQNPWIPEPYTINIEFATGYTINGSGGLSGDEDYLILWTDSDTIESWSKLTELFNNPENTRRITIHYSRIESKVFEGYTDLRQAEFKSNNSATIKLHKVE